MATVEQLVPELVAGDKVHLAFVDRLSVRK